MKMLISILMACTLATVPGGADLVFVARVFLAFIRKPIVDERQRQAFDAVTKVPVLCSGQRGADPARPGVGTESAWIPLVAAADSGRRSHGQWIVDQDGRPSGIARLRKIASPL
jgi:hypothetical protein